MTWPMWPCAFHSHDWHNQSHMIGSFVDYAHPSGPVPLMRHLFLGSSGSQLTIGDILILASNFLCPFIDLGKNTYSKRHSYSKWHSYCFDIPFIPLMSFIFKWTGHWHPCRRHNRCTQTIIYFFTLFYILLSIDCRLSTRNREYSVLAILVT